MKIINWLRSRNNLIILLEASMSAGIELAKKNADLRVENELLKREHPYVGLIKGKLHEKNEMSEYYCGKCGYPVTDNDSYCRECGGALHEKEGGE